MIRMFAARSIFFSLLTLVYLLRPMNLDAQSRVSLRQVGDQHELLLNDKPFKIKGVGGEENLSTLKDLGGNSIRTWGVDRLGEVLDAAERHQLMVCAGIWLGHQRHGFSYQDADGVAKQLEEALASVKQYKDHPALLMWGVGNEMEGEGNDPSVWYAVNHLAREIKKIDPDHPTMTVIAELGPNESKLKNISRFCPDVEIVGVNSYGGIESIPERYGRSGIKKPYIITEHGPVGPWEIGKTPWGSPIERTSTEKGEFYAKGYTANVIQNGGVCLGAYSFLWGNKQETTATWFGMTLPDDSRLEAADLIAELWSGQPTKNPCPKIAQIKVSKVDQIKPGESINASIQIERFNQTQHEVQWILRADSGTIGEGGDKQEGEAEYPKAITGSGTSVSVTLPENPNTFRLFAYVRDETGGAAVANVPLRVGGMVKITEEMKVSELPYVIYEEKDAGSVFASSGYMGNAAAISMQPDYSTNPKRGDRCLRVEYKSGDAWGGVLWQSPAEDWDGLKPGGANLTGATELEFWARGEAGGEKVNFVFGVLDGNQPYRDTARGELTNVVLTKDWNRYSIPLRGLDLRQIKTGFGWSLAGQGKPVIFFLDDIRYIKGTDSK